ncbi:MAG TPA: IS1 family transposase [Acidobacteriota bacterium]|nr:IS1 family transposase [Acidobacteriota bacterium]
MRLLNVVGEKCMRLMQEKMKNLDCRHIQVDEIWSFVGKKQKRVTLKDSSELGDQYTFVAIDAETKLVPAFRVGKRDGLTTRRFLEGLSETVSGKFQLTSDAYRPYIESVERVFGADVDYAQMIKVFGGSIEPGRERYSPASCVGTQVSIIQGRPEREPVSTSYVERQNLTMRMSMRRFTRLTNGFSKSLKNLKAAVALHFAHHNFCRVHSTLKCTPVMEAGITDRVWSLKDILRVW